MQSTIYTESDAKNGASLSRHFQESENDAYKDRLTEALGEESARSFALRAGIGPTTLLQHLSGKSLPTLDTLIATAKTANVNLLWLATGEGEKHPRAAGTIQEGSGDYTAMEVDETTLKRALEAVGEALALANREVGIDLKARIVSRVYTALTRPGGAADHAEIMRIIRAML